MEDVEVKVIDIGEEKYFFVDEIENYYFWANVNNNSDFVIFKGKDDNFILINSKDEIDSALILFYNHHQDLII